MRRFVSLFAALALASAACAADPADTASRADPTVDALDGHALLAEIVVDVPPDTTITVRASADDHDVELPPVAGSGPTRIPLLGLREEHDYVVSVDAGGDETTLAFSTGSLPDDLPKLRVDVSEQSSMQPGVTIFNLIAWGPVDGTDGPPIHNLGYLVAIDESGNVVWYHRTRNGLTDAKMTDRGTLVVSVNEVMIREIDLLGRTIREFGTAVSGQHAPRDLAGNEFHTEDTVEIDIDSAHHEVTELETGNLLTLSTRVVELDAAVAQDLCPDDPEATLVEDVVVELSPQGDVVREWAMSDVFDPADRPGTEMCESGAPGAPPNWFYPDHGPSRDWTHANAAVLETETNTLLVSLRHLDSIVALRYQPDDGESGELLWELSPDGSLELDGEFAYHQHAVEPQGDGKYLLYDNGNGRPEPGAPYSRAVLYDIDATSGTATQVWEHRDTAFDGRPMFTPFLGDVDRLPNGNVLITHGGAGTVDEVHYARIVEVEPDLERGAGGRTVFDVTIGDHETYGWSIYRSERLPSLYG